MCIVCDTQPVLNATFAAVPQLPLMVQLAVAAVRRTLASHPAPPSLTETPTND